MISAVAITTIGFILPLQQQQAKAVFCCVSHQVYFVGSGYYFRSSPPPNYWEWFKYLDVEYNSVGVIDHETVDIYWYYNRLPCFCNGYWVGPIVQYYLACSINDGNVPRCNTGNV